MFVLLFLLTTLVLNVSCNNDYIKPCVEKERLCIGIPSDCVETGDCDLLVRSVSLVNREDGVKFELFGKVKNDRKWFAVGLSTDSSMGQDSVTECLILNDNTLDVRESFTTGKRRPILVQGERTFTNQSVKYQDGMLNCEWIRRPKVVSNGHTFDIINQRYFVLLAYGPFNGNYMSIHSDRLASESNIDLQSIGILKSQSRVNYLIKIHGSLMILVWIGMVSISIMIARNYKSSWPDQTLGNVKIWFALHRSIMAVSFVGIIIGMASIFIYLGTWNGNHAHPYLGAIANVLMFIQPLMALCRCSPDSHYRSIFNWAHWAVGNVAHITAITAIFFATTLTSILLPRVFSWLLVFYVSSHVLVHIIMQVHSICITSKVFTDDLNMIEISSDFKATIKESRKGEGFRQFMLGLYVVIISVFTLALILLTVTERKR